MIAISDYDSEKKEINKTGSRRKKDNKDGIVTVVMVIAIVVVLMMAKETAYQNQNHLLVHVAIKPKFSSVGVDDLSDDENDDMNDKDGNQVVKIMMMKMMIIIVNTTRRRRMRIMIAMKINITMILINNINRFSIHFC